ncbi:hypothetical protein [Pararhizobium sp. DWP3-4]|uniref:hypothetical protein n=1 Tax=Pararhizobium sp. DWP3-4 TaxID=2804565 RepID=UPI003CF4195B
MEKSTKRIRLEEERDQLKDELANEFKFFSATNEFREGMLPHIIAVMTRYDRIERVLKRYQDEVFTPLVEPQLDIDAPPVEGDTLHFLGEKPPSE